MTLIAGTVNLTDFSPGIMADYHSIDPTPASHMDGSGNGYIRTPQPEGVEPGAGGRVAAVVEDTYGCCSDSSGALVPLPKPTANSTLTVPGQVTGAAYEGDWPSQLGMYAYFLLDGAIMGPGVYDSSWATAYGQATMSAVGNYHLFALYGFRFDNTGVGNYRYYVLGRQYVYRQVRDTTALSATKDFLFDRAPADSISHSEYPVDLPPGTLQPVRAYDDTAVVTSLNYIMAGIASGAFSHAGNVAIAAGDYPLVVEADLPGSYYSFTTTNAFRGYFNYPNPDTPTTNSRKTDHTVAPTFPSLLITHQDRVVMVDRAPSQDMAGRGLFLRDIFTYYGPNDPGEEISTLVPFRTEYGSENTSGVGILASISINQMLIIKHSGGGYLVIGDLANPTIQKLPFIESTYNITSYPAYTPMGLVYGTRNGVFLWAGGEQSEHLSPQLEGQFWSTVPTSGSTYQQKSPRYAGSEGRFAWWHPWVMVPNNFMLDSRTMSWWRLSAVINALPVGPTGITNAYGQYNAPFIAYVVNPTNGNLHAFPKMVTTAQNVVDYIFDPKVLNTSYSWKSQPLVETRLKVRDFKQITLVASGQGAQTITITLTGINADGTDVTPVSEVFTWTTASNSKGRPVIMVHDIVQFTASNVQVKIEVSCATSNTPAAKIHNVLLGYGDGASIPTNG